MSIAAYPTYESYKDSGVEWWPRTPSHWTVKALKHGLRINNGQDHKDVLADEGYPVYGSGGQFAFASKYLYNGEAILLGRKGTVDRPIHVSGKFWSVDTMFYAVCNKSLLPRFAYYYTTTIPFFYFSTSTALPSMTQDDLKNNPIALPPLPEQRAIAVFLDGKCAAIDAAVRIKGAQITLLRERRQILIQQAVTRGLNPAAPMKDSGIDWIAEIPAHWEIAKLKFLSNKIVDGTHFTPEYLDDGVPFLRVTDLSKMQGGKIQWENVRRISARAHRELIKRADAEKGDILISKNGTIGLTKVIDWNEEFSFFVSLCLIKLRGELNPFYFEAFFNSPLVDQQVFFGSFRTSVTNLHLERIKELLIVVPPLAEQIQLIDYIREVTAPLNDAISIKKSQIAALKEYKTSLINAAVTGKIRVIASSAPEAGTGSGTRLGASE